MQWVRYLNIIVQLLLNWSGHISGCDSHCTCVQFKTANIIIITHYIQFSIEIEFLKKRSVLRKFLIWENWKMKSKICMITTLSRTSRKKKSRKLWKLTEPLLFIKMECCCLINCLNCWSKRRQLTKYIWVICQLLLYGRQKIWMKTIW